MRYSRWAGPAVLLLLCATAQAADDVWMTDFEAARKRAEELQRPMLIHFGADWCGPCRQMERNVLHTTKVKEQIRSSVVAVKVNVDRQPKLAARFGVTSLPTDLFIEPDGTRLMQSAGYRPASEYASSVARASTRYHDLLAARRPAEPKAPIAAVPQNEDESPKPKVTSKSRTEPVLDGFCPVVLWEQRRWIKGSPQFKTEYRGQLYHLSSEESLEMFEENPSDTHHASSAATRSSSGKPTGPSREAPGSAPSTTMSCTCSSATKTARRSRRIRIATYEPASCWTSTRSNRSSADGA